MDALLVGIPDASVFQQNPEAEPSSVVTTGVLSKPVRVTVPLTEEVTKRYLEIREVKTGRVVTVVEVLSPKNKRVGVGRDKYLTKRQKVENQSHSLSLTANIADHGNFTNSGLRGLNLKSQLTLVKSVSFFKVPCSKYPPSQISASPYFKLRG